MESKLISMSSFDEAIKKQNWVIDVEKAVNDEIYQVRLKYKSYVNVGNVQKGDVLTLKMESASPKYNREIKLNVGTNIFDKVLEADVIGKGLNDIANITTGDNVVKYQVLDIKRLETPVLNDEMVKELGIEGITTSTDYKRYVYQENVKKALNKQSYNFIDSFSDSCEFEISQNDLDIFVESEMERCRGISKSMNLVFDEMTKEQLLGAVGEPDIPSFKKMLRKFYDKRIKSGLVSCRVQGLSEEVLYSTYGPLFGQLQNYVFKKILENEENK